ncbi:hypothetical protein LTR10_023315 [Elasticomyces elasticus]|uniref:DUF4045 domain-containing protein n=1 Tax=Exophiala sideris TaxID=1016849 RepID=A0ABR0JSG5_9EURO|nr:hypothetical protein LTR10_023315 [Elasticomyces elasticus]KAK5040371.1 hypothetical protein LTS07_000869 [Exophiala sideris]KAK5043202.1 hypothetical protein LTR13_000973 [Exophiala sideris]KAK5068749.1 hypothetical protein LTR69_000870 [Exophiala sideris]KAK5186347.1 hypothetical protein LTR44_001403 [Eurotiomycetes sp. CCFEE 6388]
MGKGQRFQVLGSLRRGKSTAQKQERKADGKENKAQHILGLTEAALDTARAQSISSSSTAGVPALSLSDATTEFGSSTASTERPETTPELKLKASSVLLHEEFCINAEPGNLALSRRLTPHGSSSTLNSHYDAQALPAAISQQTSESSRRDFALRKGSPLVINSITPDKVSQRQMRLLKKPRKGQKAEDSKLSKLSLRSPDSSARSLFGSQRSVVLSEDGSKSTSALPTQMSVSKNENRHQKPPRSGPGMASTTNGSHEPTASATRTKPQADASHLKVNIRRPKVGVKHWFDGFECDSSEDEAINEPELDQSFVNGMEAAFENGRIGLLSKASDAGEMYTSKDSDGGFAPGPLKVSRPASKKQMLGPEAIPPRVSTLNAKSSKSTLSQPTSHHLSTVSSKAKANSLAANDLHQTSVLDLSSSDDDEPEQPEEEKESLPQLRDSIAVESLIDSDIVIGTAKAVDTKQTASIQATPSLKRVRRNQARTAARSPIEPPHDRGLHHRATYLSDQSSETTPGEADLLGSFPPTPTDVPSSARTSILGSRFSDNLSIESTRLVSVTKHEESLLTAIRLRKALNQVNGSRADPRMQALGGSGRDPTRQQRQPQESSIATKVAPHPRSRTPDIRDPIHADVMSDGASYTTFQTNRSIEQSTRFSFASFRSDSSLALEDSVFLKVSPHLLATANGPTRLSRATFLSTSTDNSREASRTRRENNYRTTLEKLSSVPDRDDISSQDFIDWPYHGWESRAAVTAAH